MAKRKTYQRRASEFFNFKISEMPPGVNSAHNILRLEQFWKLWLENNKSEPSDGLYGTIRKLLIASDSSDLYEEYLKLRTVKVHSLEHMIILFGTSIAQEKYNNKKIACRDNRLLTDNKKLNAFFKLSKVKNAGLSVASLSQASQNELQLLFNNRPWKDFHECHNILIDLIVHYAPNFIQRFNIIRTSKLLSDEYLKARYSEKWEEVKNENRQIKQNTAQKNFKSTIEHWLMQGYSLEDSTNYRRAAQTSAAQCSAKVLTGKASPRSLEYWLLQGETIENASTIVKKIQSRDLNFFVHTYGEEDGLQRFNDRISKCVSTWLKRPENERDIINKSKGRTYEQLANQYGAEYAHVIMSKRLSVGVCISKESLDFFKLLDEMVGSNIANNSITGYKGPERWIKCQNSFYFLDYVVGNCVIEYNGSFWHADPRKYISTDTHPVKKQLVSEIWDHDKKKCDALKNLNYNVLTIWSTDVKNNQHQTLLQCKDFINEHYRI